MLPGSDTFKLDPRTCVYSEVQILLTKRSREMKKEVFLAILGI